MVISERPLYMTWRTITVGAISQKVRKLFFVGTNGNVTSTGILCEKGENCFTEIIK